MLDSIFPIIFTLILIAVLIAVLVYIVRIVPQANAYVPFIVRVANLVTLIEFVKVLAPKPVIT